MGMGFPDFNGCYIAFPSSEFPRSSRVVISHVSLSWSTQHVLLKQSVLEFICVFDIRRGDSFWIPVSQWGMRERFPHIEHHLSNLAMRMLINSSILKGVSSGVCPRQNTLEAEQGDMEIVDWLMDRAFWLHSGPRMAEKPVETSGTSGMKRQSGVG